MSTLTTAISIIKQTNVILTKRFKTLGADSLRFKKNQEIVTNTDLEVNKFITKKLLKHFPNDDVVSEEARKIDNPGKNTWYVDPLDGTTNFSYGLREFGACLAKVASQNIELGVVGIPLSKEIYWAEREGAAYLNNKKIKVSSTFNHGDKFMLMICGGHKQKSQLDLLRVLKKIDPKKVRFRVFSAASVELSAVACGRADGCIISGAHPWDILAGTLIIRAAGGRVTNFAGDDWTIKDETFIASNGLIHDQLLEMVK